MALGYSWNRPITSDGSPARYLQVLFLLDDNGPMTKNEILNAVWNVDTINHPEWFRGHMATLFAAMNDDHIIDYNTRTKKWSIGEYGRTLIDKYKPMFNNAEERYNSRLESRIRRLERLLIK